MFLGFMKFETTAIKLDRVILRSYVGYSVLLKIQVNMLLSRITTHLTKHETKKQTNCLVLSTTFPRRLVHSAINRY